MDRYAQFTKDAIDSTLAREAYARYLQGLDWDFFFTVTFRNRFRDSIKAHEIVWETIAPHSARAFLATERHRRPNLNCHVHGLVKVHRYGGTESGQLCATPTDLWRHLYGNHGRSRVEPVRSIEDVSAYCSKYVVKRLSDYGFYGRPKLWT